MYNILITGALHPVAIETLTAQTDLKVDYKPDLPYDEVIKIIGDYHCLISRSETNVDKNLIDHARQMTVIARAAVGIGNIDVEYATEKGILVFNTPGKNTNSAAELTLTLLLSVMRNLTQAHKNMEKNSWDRHQFVGRELLDKTVGVIGIGNVGHRVARFLHGFDCEVLAYDPYVTSEHCQKHFARKVELDELLEKSDIITIHTPKNRETINMINAEEISKMKDGVVIINAARGGLINEPALEKALDAGKVSGAGIDTWDVEPVKEHALKRFPNVVMTPHIGASTQEAMLRIAKTVAAETIKALRGGIVSTPVNLPEMKAFDGALIRNYSVLAERLGAFSRQYLPTSFGPKRFEFLYRGKLSQDDWALIKLSYLKGFLKETNDDGVSYVNTLQIAASNGFECVEIADEGFTDYESAIRVSVQGEKESFSIGGTVFGREHLRLSYLEHHVFEVEPQGVMLVVENQDSPGVIGHVGTVLAKNGVNINQFELSRVSKGGTAMAVVLVDDDLADDVMEELNKHPLVNQIRKIII